MTDFTVPLSKQVQAPPARQNRSPQSEQGTDDWFVNMRKFLGDQFSPDHPLWMPDARPANRVKLLLDGAATYNAIAEAIDTARKPSHFVYLAGWDCFDDFNLVRKDASDRQGKGGTTLRELLKKASGQGAMVRALFWYQEHWVARRGIDNNDENRAARDAINSLKHGQAILDGRVQQWGSHHQKLVLVNGSQGLIAFAGGRDFHPNRIFVGGEVRSALAGTGETLDDPSAPARDLPAPLRGPPDRRARAARVDRAAARKRATLGGRRSAPGDGARLHYVRRQALFG
jgi:phosphatidylserine/phosphatidylglycerophosphate/cardiolipin synthase-like enzyme